MSIPFVIAGATYGIVDYTTSINIKEKIVENPIETMVELGFAGALWGSFAHVITKVNIPSQYKNGLVITVLAGGLYNLYKNFR